jgi:hypothetical protein
VLLIKFSLVLWVLVLNRLFTPPLVGVLDPTVTHPWKWFSKNGRVIRPCKQHFELREVGMGIASTPTNAVLPAPTNIFYSSEEKWPFLQLFVETLAWMRMPFNCMPTLCYGNLWGFGRGLKEFVEMLRGMWWQHVNKVALAGNPAATTFKITAGL